MAAQARFAGFRLMAYEIMAIRSDLKSCSMRQCPHANLLGMQMQKQGVWGFSHKAVRELSHTVLLRRVFSNCQGKEGSK
jgi:hypothetical protein